MTKYHWLERAYDNDSPYDPRLLGQDENGQLWVPSRTRPDWWDRKLNLRNPTHWPAYLRSRLRRAIVWIETGAGR